MSEPSAIQVVVGWEPLLPPPALVVAGVTLLLLLLLSWRSSRGLRTRRRLTLLGLRTSALLVLAAIVAGPVRVTSTGHRTRDPFVVLLDASGSMQVQDVGGLSRAAVAGRWLAEHEPAFGALAEDLDVRYVLFGEETSIWGGDGAAAAGVGPHTGEPLPSHQSQTDVGAALFSLPGLLDGARPAGVLLVSDGADRAAFGRAMKVGGPAAVGDLLAGVSFPVSTWTVGDVQGARDLSVTVVSAPPFGFVRRPLTLTARVTNRGLPAQPVSVALRADGELADSAQVRVEGGASADVTFTVKPDSVGYHTYEIAVPVPEGDAIPVNNRIETTVKVVRDRTRILQVTSAPSWDVKFLRRLLKTDPNVDLVSFFILRHRETRSPLLREELSLIEFPYEDLFGQDLEGFDAVIFQNFWFGSFMPRMADGPLLDNIAAYVRAGGAFLMVGGDASFGQAEYGASPLRDIMPTLMPEGPPDLTPFRAQLTDTGLRHPVTRLHRDEAESASRWASLPLLPGRNLLGALQDGGLSLLEDGRGNTVAAVRAVEKGRTMAVATDGTFGWALAGTGGPGGGEDHATFWRNAIRWLVKDVEQRQVSVLTDRENYRVGDTVQTEIRVLGIDYAPRVGVSVEGSMTPVRGGVPHPFSGVTDPAGQVTVSLPAEVEGTMRILARVADIEAPFGEGEARISVTDGQGELLEPGARPDLLAAIAIATGGEAFVGPGPDPATLPRRPVDALLRTDRQVEPLWAGPLPLLILLAPLCGEWILRRRLGLR